MKTQHPVCPVCGSREPLDDQFCRNCGHEFDVETLPGDVQVVHVHGPEGEGGNQPRGWAGSIIKYLLYGAIVLVPLGIVIFVVGILVFPYGLRGSRSRPMARTKMCYANQRVLLGAIEMYNMDNSDFIRRIEFDTEEVLLSGKYLKSKLTRPESACNYGSASDLASDGVIVCSMHGSVD